MFSWGFALLNVLLVIISGIIAFTDGRLTKKQLGQNSLPWTAHPGNFADLIAATVIVGLIMPYADSWAGLAVLGIFIISLLISIYCHIIWGKTQPIPGHIIDPGLPTKMPLGGFYHLIYMTIILTIISCYYFLTPKPPLGQLLLITMALTTFLFMAIILPSQVIIELIAGDKSLADSIKKLRYNSTIIMIIPTLITWAIFVYHCLKT